MKLLCHQLQRNHRQNTIQINCTCVFAQLSTWSVSQAGQKGVIRVAAERRGYVNATLRGRNVRTLLIKVLPKCDLTKPTCRRCAASGLTCGGYARDRQFVNGGLNGNKLRLVGADKSVLLQQQPWREQHVTRVGSEDDKSEVALSDSLVVSARQKLYLGHLWTTVLPSVADASQHSDTGWARLTSQMHEGEPSLQFVTMAMAMACLAVERNDDQLRVKSLQTYNTAVRELQATLKRRDAYKRDGLIVAAGLMASFEASPRSVSERRN
jgi:hypothetical protein